MSLKDTHPDDPQDKDIKPTATIAQRSKPSSFKSRILSKIPPTLFAPIRSPDARKILLRCWLASWASFVVLLPHASLRTLGNAGFFSVIASLLMPPFLPFQMTTFLISTLVIGLLLGWGIGAAAMRAALASRSQVLLASEIEKVQSSLVGSTNPDALYELAIFQGKFLDTRSSVVFACFLALGSFCFALLRSYSPKLTLLSMFATIALDVFCTFGPLFPVGQYTILNSILISTATYVAIALVCTTFVFPRTMNHTCLSEMSTLLDKMDTILKVQSEVLKSEGQGLDERGALMSKITGLRTAAIGAVKGLSAKLPFINLEFNVGRWSGSDVRDLEKPMTAVVLRVVALNVFARLVGNHEAELSSIESEASSLSGSASGKKDRFQDTYLMRQVYSRHVQRERQAGVTLKEMLPLLESTTSDLRTACIACLSSSKAILDHVAAWRLRNDHGAHNQALADLTANIEKLSLARAAFKEQGRLMLIEPYLEMIKEADTFEKRKRLPLRALFLGYVFASNLISVAESVMAFAEEVQTTAGKRKKTRLWAPKELRALAKLCTSRGGQEDAEDVFGEQGKVNADKEEEEIEATYGRDPDSAPPSNIFQKFVNIIHKLRRWTGTAEAMFAFKYAFLSVALFLPSVFSKSAEFYYKEKGLWALIMAQTTLNIYASDQMFNYVIRLAGTIVGLILGLLAWYIGNGNGYSVYGIAASSAVFFVPVLWLRLYTPPAIQPGVILACATFALIIGYSQVDQNLVQIASPGTGWSVAWKRWTLVIIGSAASFIMMLIPPQSGRKAVRLRNARTIMTLNNLYSFLISFWISETSASSANSSEASKAQWLASFRSQLVVAAEEITEVRRLTDMAKWEGNLRGAWPQKEYQQLMETETEILSSLALMGGALSQMSDEWRVKFLHSTRVLNPNFLGDVVAVLSLISQSLRTAEPMHQVLPRSLLERLLLHSRSTEGNTAADMDQTNVIDFGEVQSVNYMYYASGLVAVYEVVRILILIWMIGGMDTIHQGVDELHRITRALCGEVPLKGFARWKEEYDQKHLDV